MYRVTLDSETTGLDPETDELLQLSMIDDKGTVLFNEFFKPKTKESWEDAEKVNHITPEMAKSFKDISLYIEEIQTIIDQSEEIIGFNTPFDLAFLKKAGIHIPDACRIIDVMRDFAYIYGEWSDKRGTYRFKNLRFCAAFYGYDWEGNEAHNALADSKATLYCYRHTETDKKKMEEGSMNGAVVYFSRADENYFEGKMKYVEKGNTEIAAEILAELTKGKLIRIEMAEPYAADYMTCVLQAKQHFMDNARPALCNLPHSMDEYDVIYLGYPNYCGTIPMPVASFLESFDLKGKRIMPFCTNEGSGMGNSIDDIKKIVPDTAIGRGLPIHGTTVCESKEDIINWLTEAKLL